MAISFKPVEDSNKRAVLALRVAQKQTGFIETVAECLDEAEMDDRWHPAGIYADNDILVGFVMYGSFKSRSTGETRVWLDRLLIDEKYQGKGLGKAATLAILARLFQEYGCDEVYLSVYNTNKTAIHLYTEIGFAKNGQKDTKGEDVMVLSKSDFIRNNLSLRSLSPDDISNDFLLDFDRTQEVTDCWRKRNGKWVVEAAPFTDDWSVAEKVSIAAAMQRALVQDGIVYGAFVGEALIGFAAVDMQPFGREKQYVWLFELHTSTAFRDLGIGKKLFAAICDAAKQRGANKLYISAHSAVETQAFYKSLGCVDAMEINHKLAEKEPFDRQLEYVL